MHLSTGTSSCLILLAVGGNAFIPYLGGARVHQDSSNKHGLEGIRMVAAPLQAPTSSAPVSREQFDSYVQSTYGRYPLTIVRGEGCKLYDTDGKEYLDFVAGISTCALGHADPDLVAAVSSQMKQFHHVSNLYYIPEQGELAQWLVENSCADRVFFCNSGAEANEAAIKLARKYAHTMRGVDEPVIVTAHQSFHGRTLATITATGQPKYQKSFGPLVPGFEYTTYNDIEELKGVVSRINDGAAEGQPTRAVAAIMMEALQGEGGVVPATREYFEAVRQVCDDTGALMICDEVQVGMGRTGSLWGFENHGVEPDIFTSAKALGGGVPIGAMMCKAKVDVFQPGDHASTFGGNPLACAAAKCVTAKLQADGGALLKNVQARGVQLRNGLQTLADKFPDTIEGFRGWGLMNGLVLREDSPVTAGAVVGEATKLGLLLVPAGPKVVRFVPPLVVSEEEVDMALATLQEAMAAAVAQT
ncbi:unnamed protein product [Discosporangium mesarthrocarpum]